MPAVDDIINALRLCAVETPAESPPCEGCYLFPLSKDGRMSTGQTCFTHLMLDTIDLINRLNNFEHSQCAQLLKDIARLKTIIKTGSMSR